jgi:hypothetical protein
MCSGWSRISATSDSRPPVQDGAARRRLPFKRRTRVLPRVRRCRRTFPSCSGTAGSQKPPGMKSVAIQIAPSSPATAAAESSPHRETPSPPNACTQTSRRRGNSGSRNMNRPGAVRRVDRCVAGPTESSQHRHVGPRVRGPTCLRFPYWTSAPSTKSWIAPASSPAETTESAPPSVLMSIRSSAASG